MIRLHKMPLIMGAAMGGMMVMMLHSVVTGQSSVTLSAALLFIGAHVLVGVVALAIAVFGITRFPRLAQIASRWHRPSPRHVLIMLASASLTVLLVHLMHGAP